MPSGVDWKIHTCLSPHPEFALHFSQLNMHEHAKVDTLYPTLYTHPFTQRIALTVCAASGRRSFGSGCLGLGCFGYLWISLDVFMLCHVISRMHGVLTVLTCPHWILCRGGFARRYAWSWLHGMERCCLWRPGAWLGRLL